jgi:hypothetical protein
MIELKYRRGTRKHIKTGLGQPSPMSQVPEGAQIATLVDGVATLLYAPEFKVFDSHADTDEFVSGYVTESTWIVQMSRKVLAQG